ncbi:phosphatidylinositol glycan anchor biosynthesis class Z [Amblyomma americanum]
MGTSLVAHVYHQVGAVWIVLALLRITLVFAPQTSYIHPDEFFQSTEVVAGDLFGIKVHRTWEFTSLHPIRSAAVIYMTAGLPLCVLKCIWYLIGAPGTVPSPYMLLVVPRLFACLASFACDYAVYHLSAPSRRIKSLGLFASSYVALVFYTRTFSNSVESWLLALLLVCVKNVVQGDQLKLKDSQVKVSRSYAIIAALLCLGTFNRPSFVCFALPAVIFWLFSRVACVVKTKKRRSNALIALQLVKRVSKLASLCLVFAAPLVIADTCYFHPEAFSRRILEDPASLQLVVTPLNFIRYNLNVKNLESHGSHPYYLHLVLNVPLLYNVLGVIALWASAKILYSNMSSISRLGGPETLPVSKTMDTLVGCTVLLAICTLSFFKHQEPRFLVPLLVPVVLLAQRYFSTRLAAVWTVANIACLLFFGFFHQGGLVPCLLRLQHRIALHSQDNENATVMFAHTYMPPRHLLAVKQDSAVVEIVDMMGRSLDGQHLMHYLGENQSTWKYLVAPSSVVNSVAELRKFRLQKQFSCGFHFSGEHLPELTYEDYSRGAVTLSDLHKAFSLTVYLVQF